GNRSVGFRSRGEVRVLSPLNLLDRIFVPVRCSQLPRSEYPHVAVKKTSGEYDLASTHSTAPDRGARPTSASDRRRLSSLHKQQTIRHDKHYRPNPDIQSH